MIGHANSYLIVQQLFKFRLTLIKFSIKTRELFPHLQRKEPWYEAYLQRRVPQAFLVVPGGEQFLWRLVLLLFSSCLFPQAQEVAGSEGVRTESVLQHQYLALLILIGLIACWMDPIDPTN